MRYLLRQGDSDGARKQLDRLAKLAPDSAELKSSRSEMNLNTGDGRQELQQARLLGVGTMCRRGVAAFEKLFGGVPPIRPLAIEYWTLVARLPARHKEAVAQLKKLDASSPGNADLQAALAKQMFADNKPAEGFAYLEQMSRSAAGRGAAADVAQRNQKDMPVQPGQRAGTAAFPGPVTTGESAANARVLLAQQARLNCRIRRFA